MAALKVSHRAWYPDAGGNLLLKVGGDLSGNLTAPATNGRPNPADKGQDSVNVGNWLWRQGNGNSLNGQPAAWWINFGSYTASTGLGGADQMAGFTGFGTLGGGDLDVQVDGDAGVLNQLTGSDFSASINPRQPGVAVGGGQHRPRGRRWQLADRRR